MSDTKKSYLDNANPVATDALRPNDEVYSEILLEKEMDENDHSPAPINMEVEDGKPLQIIELEYINYDLDKFNIRRDAAVILDRMIGTMKQFPDLEIRIESSTFLCHLNILHVLRIKRGFAP